jgi:predicted amidophosphoribosyltransferase
MDFDELNDDEQEPKGRRGQRGRSEFDDLDADQPVRGRKRPRGEPEVFCPSCGADIPFHAKRCPECGERLDFGSTCHYCGGEVSPNAHFCNNCGAKVS